MPRNQGFSAISATRTIHLKIRTIRTILTILSILRFTLAQEKKTFNYDDNKDYFIDKGASYIVTTSYTNNKIDLSEENRDRYWTIEEPTRERYFWLKKRKKEKKGWKDRKEIVENKSGLANLIPMNAFDGVKEIKYLESRGSKKRTRKKIIEREKRNNEESSQSEEGRNSNNSMIEQRTSRNRRKEPRSEGTVEYERFGVKEPRFFRIPRGVWIKRESIRENTKGLPFRKTFFSLNELVDFLEMKKERDFYFSSKNRRKSNSSIIFGENEFRLLLLLKRKDQRKLEQILEKSYENDNGIENLQYNKEVFELKENLNLKKSINSEMKKQKLHTFSFTLNDETKSDSSINEENKSRILVRRKKDENEIEEKKGNSFYGNEEVKDLLKNIKKRKNSKEYEKSSIRDRRNVDKFSNDATLPYPTKDTIKLQTRKVMEEAFVTSSNRGKVSEDTVDLSYGDNSVLKKEEEGEERGDAIEIRLRKRTENKEVGTIGRGKGRNLSLDKKEKKSNETAYLNLNSGKKVNVSKEKQSESKKSVGKVIEKIRSSKKFSELTGHFDLVREKSRNYSKEEGQSDTFSFQEVTNVTRKEMRNESLNLKEKRKETILLSPSINYLEKEETVKIFKGDKEGKEKEFGSGIVNVSKDNMISWNSKKYRKYDTSDSDHLNSSRMPILESGAGVQSFKDSQKNIGDPLGDFRVSPRPLGYPTSHFLKNTKKVKIKDDPSNDWKRHEMNEEDEGEEKKLYHEKKIKSKDFQRKLWLKNEERMIEDTTISFNDYPKLTPLTFPNIISDEKKETFKTTNRDISDYKKEVKTTKYPIIENKFTSSFPPSLKDSISYKMEETKQEIFSNLKEIVEESIESSTFSTKKKRSKSSQVIESSTNPTTNFSIYSNKSGTNQLDSITITEENLETYLPGGNSMGRTEKSKRTSRIPNSFNDRSFSSVEIEGFTYPLDDFVTSQWTDNSRNLTFPSTSIDTVTIISIEENTLDKKVENMTRASSEWTTVSGEKTTIPNVSVNKQSINEDHNSTNKPPWPVKHSAVVEGDLVLGGLMMVHEREDSVKCGPIMPQGGVQALEAMLYTLDTLNQREIVPGVKIGAHILDDCDKDTYGLEMAVDFIKEYNVSEKDQKKKVNDN